MKVEYFRVADFGCPSDFWFYSDFGPKIKILNPQNIVNITCDWKIEIIKIGFLMGCWFRITIFWSSFDSDHKFNIFRIKEIRKLTWIEKLRNFAESKFHLERGTGNLIQKIKKVSWYVFHGNKIRVFTSLQFVLDYVHLKPLFPIFGIKKTTIFHFFFNFNWKLFSLMRLESL